MTSEYSYRDIDRIIESNSVKQKIRLYLRDRVGYLGGKFILSYNDVKELTNSVREYDREEWDDKIGLGLRLENGFKDMNLYLTAFRTLKMMLQRDLIELMEFERYETIINKLLMEVSCIYGDNETPDQVRDMSMIKLERDEILLRNFAITKPRLTEDGDISLGLTGEMSLTEITKKDFENAKDQLRLYLCYEEAMKRRIKEFDLNIPEYEDILEHNRKEIERPVSMSVRFEGVQDNRAIQVGECNLKDKTPKEYPFPALRKMIEDYSIRVQDIDLSTAENQSRIMMTYNSI